MTGRLLDKESGDWLEGHYRTAAQQVDITDILSNDRRLLQWGCVADGPAITEYGDSR